MDHTSLLGQGWVVGTQLGVASPAYSYSIGRKSTTWSLILVERYEALTIVCAKWTFSKDFFLVWIEGGDPRRDSWQMLPWREVGS